MYTYICVCLGLLDIILYSAIILFSLQECSGLHNKAYGHLTYNPLQRNYAHVILVKIKSEEWFDKNCEVDPYGEFTVSDSDLCCSFTEEMLKFCNKFAKVTKIDSIGGFEIDLDDGVKVNYTKFQNVEISKEGEKTKRQI